MLILKKEDIIEFQQHTDNDINNKHNNKLIPADQLEDVTEGNQCIVFLVFDLFTKIIGLGNWSNRVTTIAYEIIYHLVYSTLLKSLVIKSLVLDHIPPSDSSVHFISHGLSQSRDTITDKNPTIQWSCFLVQTGIVPILDIPETTMNSDLKTRLFTIPSVIGLKPAYLTESSGKRLVVLKKVQKD